MHPHSDEERPHIEALRRSVTAGFTFRHLYDSSGAVVDALYAQRWRAGVMDTFLVHGMHEAIAARYPAPGAQIEPEPLWHRSGTVAEVIDALLELPDNDRPGAPRRRLRAPDGLWVPGRAMR
ncbi:hypothetical protein SAMN06265360_11011 [Haloechinothrix alba]|uniref:Uncharacterized protein n=1 Tax=Haloechinothrix alba TaxID=664784 RepID=A0A238X9W1_9PSEU|nr:hypothetical protein [Haloechinothrix alba]SNR55727.1 hypothetical protein SAMN06265360_11011 [Haloechinothrix alba]